MLKQKQPSVSNLSQEQESKVNIIVSPVGWGQKELEQHLF